MHDRRPVAGHKTCKASHFLFHDRVFADCPRRFFARSFVEAHQRRICPSHGTNYTRCWTHGNRFILHWQHDAREFPRHTELHGRVEEDRGCTARVRRPRRYQAQGIICALFPLVLLSHKAAIFRTAKFCEQIHEGDSRIGTGWWIWIAWLWRRVARVLPLLSGV